MKMKLMMKIITKNIDESLKMEKQFLKPYNHDYENRWDSDTLVTNTKN